MSNINISYLRNGQVTMCRHLTQAIALSRDGLDEGMLEEGETYIHFAKRMYAHAISNVIMVTAVLDKYAYMADDLARRDTPELDELRDGMMRHYYRYTERLKTLLTAPEDFIEDLRYKAQQRANRKMEAMYNSLAKEATKQGIPHPELYAALCSFENFVRVAQEAYKACVKPLGKQLAKVLPDYLTRALDILEWAGNYAKKMLVRIDPEGKGAGYDVNKTTLRMATSLLEKIISEKERDVAVRYANKENNIQTNKTK